MRFIYQRGRKGRMHIQFYDRTGEGWNTSLCGQIFAPVTTINPPFTLGKGVCKHCQAVAAGQRKGFEP